VLVSNSYVFFEEMSTLTLFIFSFVAYAFAAKSKVIKTYLSEFFSKRFIVLKEISF
jgi:hypothetical protein